MNIFYNLSNFGRSIALISFIIGTVIFISHRMTGSPLVAIWGYIYIILATVINLIVLIFLLVEIGQIKENRNKNLITIFIILVNIPICISYIYIALNYA